MDGLFVDDNPAPGAASPVVNGRQKTRPKRARPSDKRRAEGFEDGQPGGPDTSHSLQDNGRADGPSASRLSFAAGVLTCVKGTEEGLALNLIEGTYTIGRGRDNNFVLKDIAASRSHLKIEVHDNCVTVTDLKSGNGSRVNGRRIRNAVLSDGDVVEIGNTSLRFEYHGNDLSREMSHSPEPRCGKKNGVPADSQVRQPTQERIAEAAERLAAELSERIRHEDSFEDLDTAQLASQPAANSPIGPPIDAPPPDQNGSLVEAIDNMVKDMSSPGASLQVSELWNETATHVPLSEVIPAEDPRRPHPAPAMQPTAMPPPPPQSAPVEIAPPLVPATPHHPQPPPLAAPPHTAAPPRKSSGLLIALMVFFFIVTVGVGGFATWYFVWPLLDAPPTNASTQAEYANAIASAAMAIADGDLDKAEAQARKALEFAPGDAEAKTLIEKIKKMRGSGNDRSKKNPAPSGKKAGDDAAEGAGAAKKEAAKETPKAKATPKAAPKKAAPKKAAPKKAAPKPKPRRAAEKPKPKPKPRRAAKPKPTPKPKPKPAPRAAGMSDAQAEKAMKSALRLKREDPEAACVQFKKIAKRGPSDSIWVKKAKTWAGRCR